jgi:flagellar biosynthetic protein FlhB
MADPQKTEKATPRRLKKAREDGEFPSAREFVSAIQFSSLIYLAGIYFPHWFDSIRIAIRAGLRDAFRASLTPSDLFVIFNRMAFAVLRPLGILGFFLMGLTVLIQMMSANLSFSFTRLKPNFQRINPIAKLKDLPGTNAANFLQAIVMIPVLFWIVWSLIRSRMEDLLRLPMLSTGASAILAGSLIREALRQASFALVLLGIVMLFRERGRYGGRMKMSKQDLKDEAKDTEGNPQTKARVRRIQRDMRRRNMMRDVATATAVIVNPTHFAVAIKYEQGVMAAPQVVAKGKNYLAARIRERAIGCQVPIVENAPLAQALYKSVDVGQEIPAHLYRAVAEILAYIFRLMRKTM